MTKLAGDVRAKLALYKLSTFPTVGNINLHFHTLPETAF